MVKSASDMSPIEDAFRTGYETGYRIALRRLAQEFRQDVTAILLEFGPECRELAKVSYDELRRLDIPSVRDREIERNASYNGKK